MLSPYRGLPRSRFWKTGVSDHPPASREIYKKKFEIRAEDKILTAGSCFAQHIATRMRAKGYSVLDAEPPPLGLRGEEAKRFGYNLYSARYANIYVVRQLIQLLQESVGAFVPVDAIWSKRGRFYDALRPSVEPEGLDSPEEVNAHRKHHLTAVRSIVSEADVVVFTLGLTETWMHRDGTVYPTAPGTIAGSYNSDCHLFKNMSFGEIFEDLCILRGMLMAIRPNIKILLTVSPVPLTATASDQHVLMATTYSKSVLRAAAGQMYATFDNVDYFPSYELIAGHTSRGRYYEDDLRSVTARGVDSVMSVFFGQHALSKIEGDLSNSIKSASGTSREVTRKAHSVVCEEELLEAFRQ